MIWRMLNHDVPETTDQSRLFNVFFVSFLLATWKKMIGKI